MDSNLDKPYTQEHTQGLGQLHPTNPLQALRNETDKTTVHRSGIIC